jgi:hypothetical protein
MNRLHFIVMKKIIHPTLTLLSLCLGLVTELCAQDTTFTYQGRLSNTNGPINGTAVIEFRIYATEAGGTPLWSETHAAVPVTNGLFSVALAQNTPVGATLFDGGPRWLGISINGSPELTPRQRITATPYASFALNSSASLNNFIRGRYPSVAGGFQNTTDGDFPTIGGGENNTAAGNHPTVGGGYRNVSGGNFSFVGGGENNNAGGPWATVGGGFQNTTDGDFPTVGGGEVNTAVGYAATVGGGRGNRSGTDYATVGGGFDNTSSGHAATVGGGELNTSSSYGATVGGGSDNTSNGDSATVGGGRQNRAGAPFSTVPGGEQNNAEGAYSFAAGRRAKALHDGAFVWGDSTDADVASTGPNQFVVRASGGVRFNGASQAFLNIDPTGNLDVARNLDVTGSAHFANRNVIITPTGLLGVGTSEPQVHLHVHSFENLTSLRLQSAQVVSGQTRVEFYVGGINNPQSEWRPAYIESVGGWPGYNGGLAFFVNGSGFANRFGATEVMRIQNGSLSFGASTRQMLNLYNSTYGIGVQDFTFYQRSDNSFAWFRQGVHSNSANDPGPGGTRLMTLDANGELHVGGGAFAGLSLQNRETPNYVGSPANGERWIWYARQGVCRLWSGSDKMTINPDGVVTATAFVTSSDRNAKENFKPLDSRAVLDKVAALPITRWNFKKDTASEHIGPMAQDFHAAFGVGSDDKHIATVDADGVALAAIQGLNQKLEERLKEKETKISALERRVAEIEELLMKSSETK